MAGSTIFAEYARDPRKHIELVDGQIVESPRVGPLHVRTAWALADVLRAAGLSACVYANMVLRPETQSQGALVREPEVYAARAWSEEVFQPADTMLLVCELLAPGSGITDCVEKTAEYAQAGIPHYWILELSLYKSLHLYTFANRGGSYERPRHWDGDVDIEVAGVDVRFAVPDLLSWTFG